MTIEEVSIILEVFLKKERALSKYLSNSSSFHNKSFKLVEEVAIDLCGVNFRPSTPDEMNLIEISFIFEATREGWIYWDRLRHKFKKFIRDIAYEDYNFHTQYFLKANRLYKSFKSQSSTPVKEWSSPDTTIMFYLDWFNSKEGLDFWTKIYMDSVSFSVAVHSYKILLNEI